MNNDYAFEAPCRDCGTVELLADQMWVVVTPDPLPNHVAFHCPDCGLLVRIPVVAGTVDSLAPHVAVEELDVPAEALEPQDDDTPFTDDDLIDLMLELDRWATLPPTT